MFWAYKGGGELIRKEALIIFFSRWRLTLERVGLFKERRLNREDAAFSSIDSNKSCLIRKSIFNMFILFPGLPSQSSFVQGHFKCSFKSMQSSFEIHNSCICYWIWHSETNVESIHVHNIFEANFVLFW